MVISTVFPTANVIHYLKFLSGDSWSANSISSEKCLFSYFWISIAFDDFQGTEKKEINSQFLYWIKQIKEKN